MATIPATTTKPNVPVIGFIAHVDTSPEMSGASVKPIVHRAYDGRDLVLPDDPTAVLRVGGLPYLGEQIGNDIVTASGTTLLGADNKAGVAAIVAAAEHLMAQPDIPHGADPDRVHARRGSRAQGTRYFDVARFGARCAYTMDGGARGELESESFSADAITLTFRGFNTHPGLAQGHDGERDQAGRPTSSSGCRPTGSRPRPPTAATGFVHPYVVHAGVDRTAVKLLVRDFVTAGLQEKEAWLEHSPREVVAGVPGASVEVDVEESTATCAR